MIDQQFEAAFAADLRGYAGDGARPMDAGRLARDLVARRVDRSRPLLRFGGSASIRRRLWMVPVTAVLVTGSLLGVFFVGSRAHETRLAYSTSDGLFVADGQGGNPVRIAEPDPAGSFESVAWAPDGRHIAVSIYGRVTDGTGHRYLVRIMTPDGQPTGQFQLTNNFFATISWSPDSTRIAILDMAGDKSLLEVIDVEGQNLRTVALPGGPSRFARPIMPPAWSPDGRVIALAGNTADDAAAEDTSIWLIGVDGSAWRQLVGPPDREQAGASCCHVIRRISWSPDGRQIAYTVVAPRAAPETRPGWEEYSAPGATSSVDVVDVASGDVRTVAILDGAADMTAWTPDGSGTIVRTDLRKEAQEPAIHVGLSLVAMDGSGDFRELSGGDSHAGQDNYDLPTPYAGIQPGWRAAVADDKVVFEGIGTDGQRRLATVPRDGGATTTMLSSVLGWDLWVAP